MASPRSDFTSGARAVLPALPANLPFGVIVGVATIRVSGSLAETVGLSALFFAGAAQLAAVELVDAGSPVAVAAATALLVNLRYTMYSASLAPYVRRMPLRWKALVSYFIVDVNYALAVSRYRSSADVDRRWYYLGASLPLWTTWLVGITIGAVLGAGLPGWLSLEFAFPLLFIALLFPAIEGRYTALAAVVSAAVVVAGAGLPLNLGLIVAAVAGVAAGALLEWRADR